MLLLKWVVLLEEEVGRYADHALREGEPLVRIWPCLLPCQVQQIRITLILAYFHIAVEVHLQLQDQVRVEVVLLG